MVERKETLRLGSSITIDVLYEDRYLMAIDKPAGLLVAPVQWQQTSRNLMLMLREGVERGTPWARRRSLRFITNVHRLDAETSGVLLLAKNRPALTQMTACFEARRVEKTYLMLVWGTPQEDQFSVTAPIASHPKIKGLMVVDHHTGREAHTEYRVLARMGKYSLLSAKPITGRTHQIRLHLAWRGFPVVADPLYSLPRKPDADELAAFLAKQPMVRLALHASALDFKHPLLGKYVHIESPLPKDFANTVKSLEKTTSKTAEKKE